MASLNCALACAAMVVAVATGLIAWLSLAQAEKAEHRAECLAEALLNYRQVLADKLKLSGHRPLRPEEIETERAGPKPGG